MAVAGYAVIAHTVDGGDHVVVPNIVDQSVVAAHAMLVQQGLELGPPREIYNVDKPKNHVVAQRPAAGRVVRTGRKVHPVISVGPDLEQAPNLIGRRIEDVQEELGGQGLFQVGSLVARMPHSSEANRILGQDPAPGMRIPRGTDISVLVSAGTGARGFPMADLIDIGIEEAQREVEQLGLVPILLRVDRAGAPFDIVLEQDPPADVFVEPGDEVRLMARTTADTAETWREIRVSYTVPESTRGPQEVRIDAAPRGGIPWTVYPRPEDLDEMGRPPRFRSGTRITVPLRFRDEMTVTIYLEGERVRSYQYRGDDDPIINNYDPEGDR